MKNPLSMYENSKTWQDTSDAWVKTMHESNARKRAKFGKCEHDDFDWCETCLVTVEGERIVEV